MPCPTPSRGLRSADWPEETGRSSDRNEADGSATKLAGIFPVRWPGTDTESPLSELGAARGRSRPRFSGSAGSRQKDRRRVDGPHRRHAVRFGCSCRFHSARDAGTRLLGISLGKRPAFVEDRRVTPCVLVTALPVEDHERSPHVLVWICPEGTIDHHHQEISEIVVCPGESLR